MEHLPSVRASDSDREQVAERLRGATGEGRLTTDELEDRLEAVFTARTYGELDALVADLPVVRSSPKPRVRVARWTAAVGTLMAMAAVFGLLAVSRVHSATGFAAGQGSRRFGFPGPFSDQQHRLMAATSVLAAFAVLLVCAALCIALFWGLTRLGGAPRASSDTAETPRGSSDA